MRRGLMTGARLFRFVVVSAVLVGMCVGLLVSGASAKDQLNSVVPLFCSNDRIPANSELTVRLRWAVSNKGQLSGFLSAQKLTWAVYTADGATLLGSRLPRTRSSATRAPGRLQARPWEPSRTRPGTRRRRSSCIRTTSRRRV